MTFQPRPIFHFTPESGWMNDPNGLVYFRGEYHLFYQYHPAELAWGRPLHWGHAVSEDLLHWQHLPVALEADERGDIFSGSAVVDVGNTSGLGKQGDPMVLLYTYDGQDGEGQALAWSEDGRTFTKYPGNPILPFERGDFRDPKVFRFGEGWRMVVSMGTGVRFYASENLLDWRPVGTFSEMPLSGVWECPDLFPLPKSVGEKWVLIISMGVPREQGRRPVYCIGAFDGETFTPEGDWMNLDEGPEQYASVTWFDRPEGEKRILGWAWDGVCGYAFPTAPYKGQMSAPLSLCLLDTASGLRLGRRFCEQLIQSAEDTFSLPAAGLPRGPWAVEAEGETPFSLTLSNDAGDSFSFGWEGNRLFIDRSGLPALPEKEGYNRRWEAVRAETGPLYLRALVDHSMFELLGDNGALVFTAALFPREPFTRASVTGSPRCCGILFAESDR